METLYLTRQQLIEFVQTSIGGTEEQRVAMEDNYRFALQSQTLPGTDVMVYAANYMVVCAMGLREVRNPFPEFVTAVIYGFDTVQPSHPPTTLFLFHLALFNDELNKRK